MGRPVVELLLDSTILIDRFNKIPEAKKYLADTRGKAAISVVTRAEVLTGFDASLRAVAIRFLDYFPLLEIMKPIADLAANLRREHNWKLPDAFQAALANHHGLRLVTRNTRDFSPQRHDFVVVPYTLGSEL
jgi:predicted nucleic acid-binding protein